MSENPYQAPQVDLALTGPAEKIALLEQLVGDFSQVVVQIMLSLASHAALILWLGAGGPADLMPWVLTFFGMAAFIHGAMARLIAPRIYPAIGLLMALFSVVPLISPLVWFLFRRRMVALLDDQNVRTGFVIVNYDDVVRRIEAIRASAPSEMAGRP